MSDVNKTKTNDIGAGIKMNTINDICWEESGHQYNKREGLTCPGGYWVAKELFDLTWEAVMPILPGLTPGVRYSTEELCGPEIWSMLDKVHRQPYDIGRCLKYFVSHEMLPLEVANPGTKGKNFFRLC